MRCDAMRPRLDEAKGSLVVYLRYGSSTRPRETQCLVPVVPGARQAMEGDVELKFLGKRSFVDLALLVGSGGTGRRWSWDQMSGLACRD